MTGARQATLLGLRIGRSGLSWQLHDKHSSLEIVVLCKATVSSRRCDVAHNQKKFSIGDTKDGNHVRIR